MANKSPPKKGCLLVGAIIALFAFAILAFLIERPGCGPLSNTTRKISGQIVDESGEPVPGAEVTLRWSVGLGLNMSGRSSENVVNLSSDAAGRFSGRGGSYYFGLSAKKEGYYPTSLAADEKLRTDSLSILLNRVRHPQPMVGKRAKIRIPAGSFRLEYDLLAGDCLPPIGSGSVADLVIDWRKPDSGKGENPRDVISVTIPGKGNGATTLRFKANPPSGISSLRSPHEAPENGYATTFAEADQAAGGFTGEYYGAEKVHCVKLRFGQPSGPLFGKMRGDILYIPRSAEDQFEFEYVFNPSGSRGLEMDMKQITVPGRHELEYKPDEF